MKRDDVARIGGALLLLLALSAALFAHDYWIEPSPARLAKAGTTVLRLQVGEPFHPDEERVWQPEKTTRFVRFDAKGEHDLAKGLVAGAAPLGTIELPSDGLHLLVMERAPATIELDAAKFTAYLEEEGLDHVITERRKRGEEAKPGRERYRRSLKALVRVGAAKDAVATTVVDAGQQTIELVPHGDPTLATSASGAAVPFDLVVEARFRGEPLAGLALHANHVDHAAGALVRTDAKGLATIRIDAEGAWIVTAVHMIRGDEPTIADWESYWTSLTFTR